MSKISTSKTQKCLVIKKLRESFNNVERNKKISESQIKRYKNPEERRKTSAAIKLAKSNPVCLLNHTKAQQKRYTDPVERFKAHT